MKTYSPKPADIERRWYVIDASGQVLGRLASDVAAMLRGKHKPIFAPHMDTGDHVIVINADRIELTGQKAQKKFAYRHSGYPGGIKAVRGTLPHNRLGRQIIMKLHVVAGPEHPHQAQQPVALAVGERPVWGGFPAKDARGDAAPANEPPAAEAQTEKKTEE